METIHFCSHCQQSIPLRDIQSGAADLRRGRFLCVSCRELDLGRQTTKPRNVPAIVFGVLLGGCLLLIGYLLFEQELFPKAAATPRPAPVTRADILESVEALKAELARVSADADRRVADGLRTLTGRVEDEAKENRASLTRLAEIAGKPHDDIVTRDEIAAVDARVRGLIGDVASLRAALGRIEGAVRSVETAVRDVAKPAPVVEKASEPVRERTALDGWIEKLDDPVSGNRFNAIAEICEYRSARASQALVRCLADNDFFVRRFVAEELGDRKFVPACPALVGLLADDEPSVRESAAKALRAICGKSFGFKGDASPRERARIQAKWKAHVDAMTKGAEG